MLLHSWLPRHILLSRSCYFSLVKNSTSFAKNKGNVVGQSRYPAACDGEIDFIFTDESFLAWIMIVTSLVGDCSYAATPYVSEAGDWRGIIHHKILWRLEEG